MSDRNVLVFTENSRAFGKGLISGIAKYAKVHGTWDFFTTPDSFGRQANLKNYLQYLEKSGIDGIITRVLPAPLMRQMRQLNIPVIAIPHQDEHPKGIPYRIVTHGKAIAEMAANYFLERGFYNFAYCGFDSMPWSQNRKHYFQAYLKEDGFAVQLHDLPEQSDEYDWGGEREKLTLWIEQLPKPIALLACNDDCGLQLIDACCHAGIKVPEEVSILGIDNDRLVCDLAHTGLSSMDLATEQAGYEAATLLERLMDGERVDVDTIIIQPRRVVTRESSDILAIDDAKVARAMEYIRKNARANIKVEDVVAAARASRRVLERGFKKILGATVGEEIKRHKIELICELLTETDLPIKEIAAITGFETSKHISRYFSQAKVMTLRQFRKAFGKSTA